MKNYIKKLSIWLLQNNLTKLSQEVDALSEWDQDYYDEVAEELGSEPETEEGFRERTEDTSLLEFEDLEDKEDYASYIGIMKQEGFKPVAFSDSGSSFLGGGAFGNVFSGVYQGKQAAAKVIMKIDDRAIDDDDEVNNWKKIYQGSANFPPDLKKHIPIIYKANKGHYEGKEYDVFFDSKPRDVSYDYEIIIMEQLYPLSHELREAIRGSNLEGMRKIINDEEYLYKVAQSVSDSLKQINIEVSPQKIHKIILDFGPVDFEYQTAKKLAQTIYHKIDKFSWNANEYTIYNAIYMSLKPNLEPYLYNRPKDWNFAYQRDLDGSLERRQRYSHYWESAPETTKYMETLTKILTDLNIGWNDVHNNNILMGADGNLKIVDVGLYKQLITEV